MIPPTHARIVVVCFLAGDPQVSRCYCDTSDLDRLVTLNLDDVNNLLAKEKLHRLQKNLMTMESCVSHVTFLKGYLGPNNWFPLFGLGVNYRRCPHIISRYDCFLQGIIEWKLLSFPLYLIRDRIAFAEYYIYEANSTLHNSKRKHNKRKHS